ncbi:MAG TPA: hypothetical protein VNC62_13110, partial [Burkholderiales bacterium]|nr:hypothetical protein [Burkholderiales bacterium]
MRALVTTRDFGDLADEAVKRKLRALLPAEPLWLQQVHGTRVVRPGERDLRADASTANEPGRV